MNDNEVLEIISQIIRDVAPEKAVGDLTPQTSLRDVLAIDSVELMDMLIQMREMTGGDESEESAEAAAPVFAYLDKWNNGDDVTVASLCQLYRELTEAETTVPVGS